MRLPVAGMPGDCVHRFRSDCASDSTFAAAGVSGSGRVWVAGGLGGAWGDVYIVTNLNDSGAGSLRDAVSKAHRTVVFAVSGTIDLKSNLRITQPYITVAGQTAPGDGICVRYYTLALENTHDVVVRFIRCRLGDQP